MSINKTFKIRLEGSGVLLFFLGIAALIVSIIYSSIVLLFIGLGITFWGAILNYIRSDDYVKGSLLKATTLPALLTMNQTLNELDYNGKPVYLPPMYLNNPDESKVYIPKTADTKLPTPTQIQKLENKQPSRDQQGLLITPPGAELAALFEKTLGTTFTRTDLTYVLKNMPNLMVEGLEIATDFEINEEKTSPATTNNEPNQPLRMIGKIHVAITDSIYDETNRETEQMARIHENIGCPLTSAIACVLAKSTGKLTTITEEKSSKDNRKNIIGYNIYEQE